MKAVIEDKDYFSRFVCTGPFQCQLPVFGDKNVLSFWYREDIFLMENFTTNVLLGRKVEVRNLKTNLLLDKKGEV